MTEIEKIFHLVSDGLKSMAKGLEKLSGHIEKVGKNMVKEKPKPKPKSTRPRAKAKKADKTAESAGTKETAADAVLGAIESADDGVGYATIMEKTGFDRKKVANVIFRLAKQGKIKSVKKGIYTKA